MQTAVEQGGKQRCRGDDHRHRKTLHHQREQDLGQFPRMEQFQGDSRGDPADTEEYQQEYKDEFHPHFPNGGGKQPIGHTAGTDRSGVAGHTKDHTEHHHGSKDDTFQFGFWHKAALLLRQYRAKPSGGLFAVLHVKNGQKRNDIKYSETIRHRFQRYLMSFFFAIE